MKRLLFLLFIPVLVYGQSTASPNSTLNVSYNIQIVNNSAPSLTTYSPVPPLTGTGIYGGASPAATSQNLTVVAGPCLASGAIKTFTISAGGAGYVTGDLITVNGGSPLAEYKVTANTSGVVTSLAVIDTVLPALYGGGYSIASGIATTPVTGSGNGLTIHITSVYLASPGPNCMNIQNLASTGGFAVAGCSNTACTNGESLTLTGFINAPTTFNGTFKTDYGTHLPGSALYGQTGINFPGWSVDTGIAAGSSYAYAADAGNDTFGLTTDSAGTVYSVSAQMDPTIPIHAGNWTSYLVIRKSTDGGLTWTPFSILEKDPTNTTCGGNPCYYVTGAFLDLPAANGFPERLVMGFWAGTAWKTVGVGTILKTTFCNNPTTTDCTNSTNWSAPLQFPISTSPEGITIAYNLGLFPATRAYSGSADAYMGFFDIGFNSFLSLSCDNGATWSTGTGCTHSETNQTTLIEIKDNTFIGIHPQTQELWFDNFSGKQMLGIDRNNPATGGFNGTANPTLTCTNPQLTCGGLITMYTPDITAATPVWTLRTITTMTPYIGFANMPAGSIWYQISPYLTETGINGQLLLTWGERDFGPGNGNRYNIPSIVFNPAVAAANPSSWTTGANSPAPVFYFAKSDAGASSQVTTMTPNQGAGTFALETNIGPFGNINSGTRANVTGIITTAAPPGPGIINFKGTKIKGTSVSEVEREEINDFITGIFRLGLWAR